VVCIFLREFSKSMSKVASKLASQAGHTSRSKERYPPVGRVQSRPDPVVPDWANIPLPDTRPDLWSGGPLGRLWRIVSHPFRQRQKVSLPDSLPGASAIPKYALLEFHHLPNGNYSSSLTRGYISGFDKAMLGEMGRTRSRIVRDIADCESVLDVGCGGGKLAGQLFHAGCRDIWGMDPSPYLLKHAAADYPKISFVQGIVESIPFRDQRFDGVTITFVLHEIPPRYMRQGLAELTRVLKPGGTLIVAEPSPAHFRASFFEAIKRFGWRGAYFWTLARSVHEPYVRAWHGLNFAKEAKAHGFELDLVDEGMPIKYWLFRKSDSIVRS